MELRKLFDLTLIQTEDVEMGDTSRGELLISPTSGGFFAGEKLRGEVLPVGFGTTFTRGRSNDVASQHLLRTEDGSCIMMEMEAFLDVPPDVEARLMRGEHLEGDEYYFKGVVRFETGAKEYAWLQRRVCVCQCVIQDWTKLQIAVYMLG